MCIYEVTQQSMTRSDMVKVAIEKLLNDHNQSYSVVHGYKAQITEEDVIYGQNLRLGGLARLL